MVLCCLSRTSQSRSRCCSHFQHACTHTVFSPSFTFFIYLHPSVPLSRLSHCFPAQPHIFLPYCSGRAGHANEKGSNGRRHLTGRSEPHLVEATRWHVCHGIWWRSGCLRNVSSRCWTLPSCIWKGKDGLSLVYQNKDIAFWFLRY